MLKLLIPFLFLSPSLSAEPLTLESVNPANIAAAAVPPASDGKIVLPLRMDAQPSDLYFNPYVLKAVTYLKANYGLQGYDINSILTHDIQYGSYGVLKARHAPLTMCVAAVMEVILTSYDLYAKETGDYTIYDYLPKKSFEGLGVTDIKGHIWVNHAFKADGTADALANFGMGVKVPFESLKPGSFVNINRTTKTGHAVVFLNFINAKGEEQAQYNDTVVGFRYFSSQGRATAGDGGFDYRYAVFSKFGCPDNMPGKRDCNVIYSANQTYLNTGMMMSPKYWTHVMPTEASTTTAATTELNRGFFNGITTDD